MGAAWAYNPPKTVTKPVVIDQKFKSCLEDGGQYAFYMTDWTDPDSEYHKVYEEECVLPSGKKFSEEYEIEP